MPWIRSDPNLPGSLALFKGVNMPYIEVKAVDRRFDDPAVSERLIAALTDAACQVFGEESRQQIWVVIEGVPAQRWGIGGKPLS
jgi:4-oxalocrotonate tautomerase